MAKHFADSNEVLEAQPKHLSPDDTTESDDIETASSNQEIDEKDEGVDEKDAEQASQPYSTETAIQSIERYKIDTSVLPRIDGKGFPAGNDGAPVGDAFIDATTAMDTAAAAETATPAASGADTSATAEAPAGAEATTLITPPEALKPAGPTKKRKLWLIPVVLLAVLATVYLGGVIVFHFIFMPNTTVYGIDYSLKPVSSLAASIESDTASYSGHITGAGIDVKLSAADINLTYDGTGYANDALSQENVWAWPAEIFKSRELKPTGTASYDHDKLKEILSGVIKENEEAASGQDHSGITFNSSTGKFTMSDQAIAMRILPDKADQEIGDALNSLTKDITLDNKVIQSSENIEAAISAANAYVAAAPKLKLGDNDAGAITADQVAGWISFDENLNVNLNEQAIRDYVHGDLSKQLDSKGTARTYTRPDGKEITTVAGGHYGWVIDGDKTADALINAIKSGAVQPTVDVPCLQSAVTYDPGKQDWGKRYIDVDISEQHARLYDESGSIIWEADVVTGIPDGRHNTPEGVWDITSHIRGARLLGPNDESGRPGWDTKVDFWLGVKGQDTGFHNAPWRGAFGGQIYKTGGSHGCINLSYDNAQKLFELAKDGDPVVIHE